MKQTKMFSRALSVLLTVCMVATLCASTMLAVSAEFVSETHDVYSRKTSTIAPGVTQDIVLAYAKDGKQMAYYVATADINRDDVEMHTSYKGAQIEEYGMDTLRSQMYAANEKYQKENPYFQAVAGVNGDFYNMSTGQPSGAFYMDGNYLVNGCNNRPWFAIFEDGTALCGKNTAEWNAAIEAHGAVQEAVGGSQMLIVDGVDSTATASGSYNTDRHSRSMVGVTADNKVVICTLDGRQEPFSCGGSMHELAQIMLEAGCVTAINLDGGGSSTFVTRAEGENDIKVINRPSDGTERAISTGLLIASTAAPSDVFDRAVLTAENDFVTPESSVKVDATGVSPAGTAAEIPEDATFTATLGTVDANGVFTSNGTTGDAVVSMVVDGKVVGSTTIHVVVPETLTFNQAQMTVPYGKTVEISMTATYGLNEVALKPADVQFALTDTKVGTINGFNFTAADESSNVTGSDITATLVHDTSVTSSASIALGKGSEIIFDFEDEADIDDWKLYDYNIEFASAVGSHLVSAANYPQVPGVELVTAENGQVRNGNSAMAVTVDYSDCLGNGWRQYRLFFAGEHFEISNALKIGFWIWMPEEANANEIDAVLTFKDANGNFQRMGPVLTDIGYGAFNQDEAGWHYFTVDVSKWPTMFFGDDGSSARQFYLQFYNYCDQWKTSTEEVLNTASKFTYYIDDITIEYSSAAEDTAAPIFTDVTYADTTMSDAATLNGQTITNNKVSFAAKVKEDTTLSTYTGIDASTAKAYIDGVEVECDYTSGIIAIDAVVLADGKHTVKFAIKDKNGNPASVVREITINANSDVPTVTLAPKDATLEKLPLGSLYYVDLLASEIENVKEIQVKIDLINTCDWELDHIDVAEGFEVKSYSVIEDDNIAVLTIAKTGETTLSGKQAIASIPIRVWYPDVIYTWSAGVLKNVWVDVEVIAGLLTTTTGETSTFTGDKILTSTEMYFNAYSLPDDFVAPLVIHSHTAEAVEDKAATCTEDGYTGRTFCEECNSVVDWGTTIPATGHTYEVIDGVLKCACGELYNGELEGILYVDGIAYTGWVEDTYYADGVILTGLQVIDGFYYELDENGVCEGKVKFTGLFFDEEAGVYRYAQFGEISTGWKMIGDDWHYFRSSTKAAAIGFYNFDYLFGGNDVVYYFDETGKVTEGVWYTTDEGTMYYYGPSYLKGGWQTVDGATYYFNDGYRYEGYRYVVESNSYTAQWYDFGDDGKLIGTLDDYTGLVVIPQGTYYVENGKSAYGLRYVGGYYYYFQRSDSSAVKNCSYYITNTNGLKDAGTYEFDENGRMKVKNSIVSENGGLYYYEDDVLVGKGLVEIDGNYYYVRSNGQLATGKYYVTRTNGLDFDVAWYNFDETTGAMIMPKNGIVEEDGVLYYYENDVKVGKGLFEADGNYYYAKSSGQVVTGKYYVTRTNGYDFTEAWYNFDENGAMILPKNGIVSENGGLYYYENDKLVGKGLVEIDGNFYYVRSNGQLATGKYYVTRTNGYDFTEAWYNFNLNTGAMIK